jgi:hypothetical protein
VLYRWERCSGRERETKRKREGEEEEGEGEGLAVGDIHGSGAVVICGLRTVDIARVVVVRVDLSTCRGTWEV